MTKTVKHAGNNVRSSRLFYFLPAAFSLLRIPRGTIETTLAASFFACCLCAKLFSFVSI